MADLGNLFAPIVAAPFNFLLAKKQYEYNSKLAAQQNQYNIDMWRMNNEYNTPAAQMQRFQDAGLNPNLMYGQGSAGNSSGAPQQVVPEAPDYSHAMSDISKIGNILGIAQQLETLKGQKLDNKIKVERNNNLQWDWMLKNLKHNWEFDRQLAISEKWNDNPDGAQSNGMINYFKKLYDLSLKRMLENNLNISEKSALYRTQQMLNNLQSNYYRVRNAWQPWQYGVDMGTEILGSLVPFGKLFKKGGDVVKNFNTSYNGQYRIGHNYY